MAEPERPPVPPPSAAVSRDRHAEPWRHAISEIPAGAARRRAPWSLRGMLALDVFWVLLRTNLAPHPLHSSPSSQSPG